MADRWIDPDYIEWLEEEVKRLEQIVDILLSDVDYIPYADAMAHVDWGVSGEEL